MQVIDLGQRNYRDALAVQQERLAEVVADASHEGFLLLVEHVPPVLTLGRRAKPEHVLADEATLRRAGIGVHEITRGGDVTYHGPGQLVAYPLVRLWPGERGTGVQRDAGVSPARRGVHEYVRGLEQAVVDTLATFGLAAARRAGATGVWVGDEKIAAIGVAVRRWVTWHGLALNVNVTLAHFDLIVPCGLRETGITDMATQLNRPIAMADVKPVLVQCLRNVLSPATVSW